MPMMPMPQQQQQFPPMPQQGGQVPSPGMGMPAPGSMPWSQTPPLPQGVGGPVASMPYNTPTASQQAMSQGQQTVNQGPQAPSYSIGNQNTLIGQYMNHAIHQALMSGIAGA